MDTWPHVAGSVTPTGREAYTADGHRQRTLPILLTVDEAADLLRTTRRPIYAMIARRQLPGVILVRRRVLLRSEALLHWLEQKSAAITGGTVMSVTLRRRKGGWEIDVRVVRPDGTRHARTRKRSPLASRSDALRWAEGLERVMFQRLMDTAQHIPRKEAPTLRAFAPRFMDGHARANRQKPSGIATKEMVLRVHLLPALGHKRLDAIKSEDVQRLKRSLEAESPKTANNILAVLSVLLKKAVEWEAIEHMPSR